jgi:hypothetical protein
MGETRNGRRRLENYKLRDIRNQTDKINALVKQVQGFGCDLRSIQLQEVGSGKGEEKP